VVKESPALASATRYKSAQEVALGMSLGSITDSRV
jgi:hypothetical protein